LFGIPESSDIGRSWENVCGQLRECRRQSTQLEDDWRLGGVRRSTWRRQALEQSSVDGRVAQTHVERTLQHGVVEQRRELLYSTYTRHTERHCKQ